MKKPRSKMLSGLQRRVGIVFFTAIAVLVGVIFKNQIKTGIVSLIKKVDEGVGTKVDSLLG